MWRLMSPEQEQAWHNGYWCPQNVRETGKGTEWFDASHMHNEDIEETTSPDHNGVIRVDVRCECGLFMRSYYDFIL